MRTKPLSELAVGESATLMSISPHNPLRHRLQDLGLVEGTLIRCLRKTVHGTPICFFFRSTTLALRHCDCHSITVQLIESKGAM